MEYTMCDSDDGAFLTGDLNYIINYNFKLALNQKLLDAL